MPTKQKSTTHAETSPWAPAQPVLNDILGKAQSLGNDASNFTPTYSANTQAGLQGLVGQAGQTSSSEQALRPLVEGASGGYQTGLGQLEATARGDMLESNPYLDSVLNKSMGRAADQVNAQFSGAGRLGSGAHAGVLADRLGGLEMEARMSNYGAERGNQLNAANTLHGAGFQGAQMAGALDDARLTPSRLLMEAGGIQDAMDASQRAAPLAATQWQAGLGIPIAGLGGVSDSTTTTKSSPNIAGMIGGGLMSGLGMMTGGGGGMLGGLMGGSGFANPYAGQGFGFSANPFRMGFGSPTQRG